MAFQNATIIPGDWSLIKCPRMRGETIREGPRAGMITCAYGMRLGTLHTRRGFSMESLTTVQDLCVEHQLDAKQLAEKAGVDEQRVVAILLGRWTPSPQERDQIAGVFGVTRDQIAWGHKTPIQHIYGSGP